MYKKWTNFSVITQMISLCSVNILACSRRAFLINCWGLLSHLDLSDDFPWSSTAGLRRFHTLACLQLAVHSQFQTPICNMWEKQTIFYNCCNRHWYFGGTLNTKVWWECQRLFWSLLCTFSALHLKILVHTFSFGCWVVIGFIHHLS